MRFDHQTHSPEELAKLDSLLDERGEAWWDDFYANRSKAVPFFGPAPDESLDEWMKSGIIHGGEALDLGCGNGRNAILLARSGFQVEGVDFSLAAIEWSRQRALEAEVSIVLRHASVFELGVIPGRPPVPI